MLNQNYDHDHNLDPPKESETSHTFSTLRTFRAGPVKKTTLYLFNLNLPYLKYVFATVSLLMVHQTFQVAKNVKLSFMSTIHFHNLPGRNFMAPLNGLALR